MKEEETYPDICSRFSRNISRLRPNWQIAFSQNKYLPQMIEEIEHQLGGETDYHNKHIPHLKLDILIGIKKDETKHIELVLLEVKVVPLTLNYHAQLMGYLLAAPLIRYGILFATLPPARVASSPFSSEYSTLLNLNSLPMNISLINNTTGEAGCHRIGVAFNQYMSMINWGSTGEDSISSFQSLVSYLES